MQKYIPACILVLFLVCDAFLKVYAPGNHTVWFVLLFASAVYFFLYFRKSADWEGLLTPGDSPERKYWIVVAVILFGALLRFWKLDSLFDGVFWDESYKGLDAIAIRVFGERPIFLNWNAGREALVAYLVAGMTVLSGYGPFAVRAVEALAGVVTLLFFYLFVRKLFRQPIPLICLFLLAASKYHIIYSRFGIRVNLILLFQTATLYFLARALKDARKSYLPFLLAGVAAGLGFYTYIAYRIFPLVGLALIFDKGIRKNAKARIPQLIAGMLLCALIVAPLAFYFVKNARSFSDRMSRTALWSKQTEPVPLLLLASAKNTIGMFTFKGDINPRHNVESEPALSPFSTAFFWLGMLFVAVHWRKPFALFLLLYFLFLITPGILGADAPHASRNLGALPPAIVFCSIGIFAAAKILSFGRPAICKLVFAVFLGGVFLTGVNDAIFRYSANLDAQNASESGLWGMNSAETDVAGYLNTFADLYDVYLTPQLYYHATVEYLTKSPHKLLLSNSTVSGEKISLIVLEQIPRNLWWLRDDNGKNFFKWWAQYYNTPVPEIRRQIISAYGNYPKMMNQSDRRLLRQLQARYPDGKLLQFDQFTAYLVPAQTAHP